jgi:hypothetical protein
VDARGELALVGLLNRGAPLLDLGECGLDALPPEVTSWARPALQQLRLTNNRLTDLPLVRVGG